MKRLTGAAKRAHARKVLHEAKRASRKEQSRKAIDKMQRSHVEYKKIQKIGVIRYKTGLYIDVAGNLSKIAYNSIKLVTSGCIVILCLALTFKALSILSKLF